MSRLPALLIALFAAVLASTAVHAQNTAPPPADAAPPPGASAAPDWTEAQWQALWDAAQHTAGDSAYEYKWVFANDLARARMARLTSLRNATVQRAGNLLLVPPAIRLPLANLYLANDVSAPIPYLNKGVQGFVVVQLVKRSAAAPMRPGPEFRAAAARWVSSGRLDDPTRLMAEPLARAQSAYWNATSAAAIAAVPAELSPNIEFGDFNTPLVRAIQLNQLDMAQGVFDRGADVNRCGIRGCPIGVAAKLADTDNAMYWSKWLLARGARPDTVDLRHYSASTTALTDAVQRGRKDLAELLLTAGASPDAVPKVRMTPIEAAAVANRRDLVEWLIGRGASVLPHADRSDMGQGQRGNLYAAAQYSGNKEFADWAQTTLLSAARSSARYRFDAHIEQSGQRLALADGATLSIKPAPFKLVLTLKPGEATGVTLGASLDAAWMEEVRRGDKRNPMFRPFSSAALAEPPSPQSYEFFVGRPCADNAKPDDVCPGVQAHLQADSSARKDFHETRAARHEYVREFRSVFDVSGDKDAKAEPLAQLAGKTIYMALGETVDLGGADGLRLIGPRYVTLQLRK